VLRESCPAWLQEVVLVLVAVVRANNLAQIPYSLDLCGSSWSGRAALLLGAAFVWFAASIALLLWGRAAEFWLLLSQRGPADPGRVRPPVPPCARLARPAVGRVPDRRCELRGSRLLPVVPGEPVVPTRRAEGSARR